MTKSSARRRRPAGFTLVELMVGLAVLAILALLSAPSLAEWIRNGQVRTVTNALQTGLQIAQQEAVRLNRQVVFVLTDDEPGLAAEPIADGRNWAIFALPVLAEEDLEFVRGGAFSDVASRVQIEGPNVICFNSLGRLMANNHEDIPGGEVCDVDPDNPLTRYRLHMDDAGVSHRPLVVTVNIGGQVRMCDPARTLSAEHPDGCPPL